MRSIAVHTATGCVHIVGKIRRRAHHPDDNAILVGIPNKKKWIASFFSSTGDDVFKPK